MLQLNMTAAEVALPKFVEKYACEKAEVNIQLADGVVKLPVQMCVLNSILWRI